jgi:hypothetical protein
MQYLDGIIAFSLVMLLFAQLSSKIVSLLNSRNDSRHKEFDLWSEEVLQSLDDTLVRSSMVNTDSRNQARNGVKSLISDAKQSAKPHVQSESILNCVVAALSLSTSTQHNSLISNELNTNLQRIDSTSTQRFKNQATKKTLVVSLIIAFTLNINSIELFKFISGNSDVPKNVQVLEANRLTDLADRNKDPTYASELDRQAREILKAVNLLQERQIPIGWETTGLESFERHIMQSLTNIDWYAGCLITSILAGLGAPFWRQFLDRLFITKKLLNQKSTTANTKEKEPIGIIASLSQRVDSGINGAFIFSNAALNEQNQKVLVDVEIEGVPEKVFTLDELEKTILFHYAENSGCVLKDAEVRAKSLVNIKPYLFTNN